MTEHEDLAAIATEVQAMEDAVADLKAAGDDLEQLDASVSGHVHAAHGCTHLAKRKPGERWQASREPRGPEVFCNFQRMADALDASGDAIVATANAALTDIARGLIAEGKRVFASGGLEQLAALEVPDAAEEALGKAIAAEQRKLYDAGRREVKDETAAQVQKGATVADLKPEDGVRPLAVSLARAREIQLALDTPLDAGDVEKIDQLLAVKGRTVARSMIERLRAELIRRMLDQAERGEFDPQDLLDYHESLSDRQLRQDAKILTTTAMGLGRKAEHADLVEQAASAYYSTMLDEDVCCVCEALEDREVRPDSEEYHALYPPRASGVFADCCDEPGFTYEAPPAESTEFPDCCGSQRCRCDIILRIGESTART